MGVKKKEINFIQNVTNDHKDEHNFLLPCTQLSILKMAVINQISVKENSKGIAWFTLGCDGQVTLKSVIL